MNPLVSVIIPVYNTEIYMLKQCVSSVLEQTFQDFEIVIIDDCSTKTDVLAYLDLLESISDKISIYHSEQNRGVPASRNDGIERAAGEWICFLDHDDWWEREYLKEAVCAAKDTDLVESGYQVVDEEGRILQLMPDIGNEEFINSLWFIYSTAAPWNRLIRRNFLLKNNIRFPEGCWTEDLTFNITCNYYAHNPKGISNRGYCNRFNWNSASRSRVFTSMDYNEMPFVDIERNCILGQSLQEGLHRRIHEAAIGDQLTLLVCVFSRESSKSTKNNARKKAAYLVRHYMSGYVRNAYAYCKYGTNKKSMKIIYLGYMIAIRFHMDRLYCAVIHTLLKIFIK